MSRPRYRVIDVTNGDVWDFASAEDVATHLLGRYFPDYRIYKHGVRFRPKEFEASAFTVELTRFTPKVQQEKNS